MVKLTGFKINHKKPPNIPAEKAHFFTFVQDVKITSMTLDVCYEDGGCDVCEVQTEPQQCSGAFLETKKSKI